jgi:hypothetical protein
MRTWGPRGDGTTLLGQNRSPPFRRFPRRWTPTFFTSGQVGRHRRNVQSRRGWCDQRVLRGSRHDRTRHLRYRGHLQWLHAPTGAAYATSNGFATLSISSQHQAWRLTHFGTASETGDAANTADPDGDRLSNLIEYAFGLNPTSGRSSSLPVGQLKAGGAYQLSFIQPSNVNDVVYGLEWSPTMQPGSWLPVPDTSSGMLHTFTMSTASRSRAFFRFVIVLSGDECSWALTTISLKKPLGRSVGRGNEGP